MSNYYDYGPNADFNIRFVGEMAAHNGSYEMQNEQTKYLTQAICHAIYEIKDDVKRSSEGILKLDGVWVQWLNMGSSDSYSVNTYDMMTVFVVNETGYYSFDVEFFSPNQFRKADSLLDYAYNHKLGNGRYR